MKNPETFDCEFCESKSGLKEQRNCGWNAPGKCTKCEAETTFWELSEGSEDIQFACPMCGGRVKFGAKAEFILGKTFRTPGCPKSMLSARASFLISLVLWSEETGRLPTAQALFDESNLYFEIRNFVLGERSIAEKEMAPTPKEPTPKGRRK